MRVRATGPVPCDLALVGPYPGHFEDRTGLPFQGKAGEELDRYLNGVDLPERDDLYLTNVHKFYKGKDYIYEATEWETATVELHKELARVKPTTIITMGREVTRIFLGDVDVQDVQGIPWRRPDHPTQVIFPLIHVAAGLRNSELSPYVVAGFQELARYLRGDLHARTLFDDPYPTPHYFEITDLAHLTTVLKFVTASIELSIDTEGWPHLPWSLQFSYRPGTGYLIRSTQPDLIAALMTHVRRVRPRLVFHSSLHELAMEHSLGLDYSGLAFDDTMVMAYLLQIEPQGLKPGCLRYCNMQMSDFKDIMGDVSNELAREYLVWLWDVEQWEYEQRQHEAFDAALAAGRRVKVLPKLPKTKLHQAAGRVLSSKRPRDLWEEQVLDVQVAGYTRMGPMPNATLDYVDPAISIPYGCRDADGTGRLLPIYRDKIKARGLEEVYALELSTYPLINRMQQVGLKPDLEQFAGLSTVLAYEIEQLQAQLEAATGRVGFNANSGDQVAEYLFDQCGLEEVKMTKGGRGSTNDKILEALEHEHPEVPSLSVIREYREVYKLKHTFVDRVPDFVNRPPHDGRVHATFRTTRVVTGRLAASDPNVLAQPEHGKWAEEFKRGWVADDGHVVASWDESQIELRGLAHLSQDPVMCGVYRGTLRNPDGSRIDLHAALAERIFGVKPKDQDKHKHRLPAKAVNFGIPMGMTAKGLSVELRKNGVDADEDTAQRWLDETLRLYKGVARYMEERKAEARRVGFVRCLSGRIRYIGGIRSRDDRVREEAERFAFSTPIQESAQYVMKQAEARIWTEVLPDFWRRGTYVEPLLQVHDCLKMECDEGVQFLLNTAMRDAMTQVPHGFSVPLDVEGEWGWNFADVKPFKED